ncbi:hypothetical protein Hanom_Chr11g00982161 [Helianthus anomalus]
MEPIPIEGIPLAAVPEEDWPFAFDFDWDAVFPKGDHPDDDQGDGEVADIVILDIPSHVISVIDISSDSDPDSVADSFEYVTSSALLAAGVRAYPTDIDDDNAISVAPSSPVRAPTPPPVHDHIPDPISAPIDLPPIAPLISQPPPTAFIPPIPASSLPPFATDCAPY